MINQYTILGTLGSGTFGKVKLCQYQDLNFAVKIYKKAVLQRQRNKLQRSITSSSALGIEAVYREINLMKRMHHKNVLRLHEVIDDPQSSKIYLITDHCSKGSLMEWDLNSRKFVMPWLEGPFSEDFIRKIFKNCVCGLEYLHSKKIIHRDIKPQNILINEHFIPKIGDFGQAQEFFENDYQKSTVGTYYFFPPESCSPDVVEFSGKAADIWALGITLYSLIYRKLPFWSESLSGIFEIILNFTLEFDSQVHISQELKHLLTRILDKNPVTRIKMHELIQLPWLTVKRPLLISESLKFMKGICKAVRFIQKILGRLWKRRALNKLLIN